MTARRRLSGVQRTAAVLTVAVLAVAGAAAYGFGGRDNDPVPAASEVRTAEVSRMSLVDYEDAVGMIGFGDVIPLRYTPPSPDTSSPDTSSPDPDQDPDQQSGPPPSGAEDQPAGGGQPAPGADEGLGLVTWLPAIGSIVDRGEPLLRVDDVPVVLLLGELPLYRTLRTGATGADVRQLEENLRDLGYTGFTVDDQYTSATATMVRRWQKALGVLQTGEISPGRVLYAPDPVRIAGHRVRVGDVAGGDILGTTGSARTVTADVAASRLRGDVTEGMAVTVVLPGGAEFAGTVRAVGAPPADEPPGPEPTVRVEVQLADPAALDGRQGSATVRFVVDERRDVLAVPIVALVALAEGGYGVQVLDGTGLRYVAVGTGIFARGFVEITSGDVAAGTRVVIPA
jgi:peptidoglycan hydrolase-like protein with peptidoglycan-binding domain